MSQVLVLSLKPQWSNLILNGEKTQEVRKRFGAKIPFPATALIYTSDTGKCLSGTVTVTHIETLSFEDIDARNAHTRIPTAHLTAYLNGQSGTILHLQNPQRLKTPIPLATLRRDAGFTPPQSFCYATPALLTLLTQTGIR